MQLWSNVYANCSLLSQPGHVQQAYRSRLSKLVKSCEAMHRWESLHASSLDCLLLRLAFAGLWRYSRHPNHVGEQLFWWGISLFAVSSQDYWTLVGPLFNTICMVRAHICRQCEPTSLQKHVLQQHSLMIVYFLH